MSAYIPKSETVEWGTPQKLFDKLNLEFGFTLDAAASDENHKVENYLTISDDALNCDWNRNVVWLNPPYGRALSKWMKKAYEESQKGAIVVCLVPARTDTAWWHDYAMRGQIEFLRGRVKFVRNDGLTAPAPFPSAIVVFR